MKETIELDGQIFDSGLVLQERFGIRAVTVWRWTERGLLPTPTRIGRTNYYRRDQVEETMSLGERNVADQKSLNVL
jgi:hypothetical protein